MNDFGKWTRSVLLILFFLQSFILPAQSKRVTISGNVVDASNGEDLIGVNIYIPELKAGTATNSYGFYSLSVPPGTYLIEYSYMGYEMEEVSVTLTKDIQQNIRLKDAANVLNEVVVSGERRNINITRAEMSVEKLTAKTIKRIPAMMGEVDVIKALQLLPGIQSVSEGSSSFSVRGGGHDQNLILLDEATIYSASHLMGFFSVFNNDVVKDVQLYKGDIPAVYGGRLSSLMDVRTKDGNNQRFSGTGGVGTISSRLTLEGPLFSDKASFIVAGRRTYADIFLPLAKNEGIRDSRLYFYDLNAKVNYRINPNNRVFLSGYLGRDRFAHSVAEMNFGNKTFTARWNHIFSPKLFSNFTFIGSFYDYYLGTTLNETIAQDWESGLQDLGAKVDFSYHINPANTMKFGYDFTHHTFSPGKGGGIDNSKIAEIPFPQKFAIDHALYVSNETTLFDKLTLRYGLRFSAFQNLGNDSLEYVLDNYQVVDSAIYRKGKVYHTQSRLEPRLGINYAFNDRQALKASYSRTAQYIQLASNSSAGSPLDLWFQASKNVKPQMSDQFAIGYFHNFADDMYESSVEVYYKHLTNVVDFKDRAALLVNQHIEKELRFGIGKAFGAEFLVRKNRGDLTGWVSYTYARSFRRIDEVNSGDWYRSPNDRPHNISIVVNYDITPKWSVGGNWVYSTGMPVTYPVGRYEIEGVYVPIYSKRNEYRYPDYHRLDLSVTWKLSEPQKRFQHELNFSLYNAYGRKNPWTVYFLQEEERPEVTYGEMLYLFSFVPSITWNFSF